MTELTRVLQKLYDTEAHSGTLAVEELEQLKTIISEVGMCDAAANNAELMDNLEEARAELRRLEEIIWKVREALGVR